MGFVETLKGIFGGKGYKEMFSSFLNQLSEYTGKEIPKKILQRFIESIDKYIGLLEEDGFEDSVSDLREFKKILLEKRRFSKYQFKQLNGVLADLESK